VVAWSVQDLLALGVQSVGFNAELPGRHILLLARTPQCELQVKARTTVRCYGANLGADEVLLQKAAAVTHTQHWRVKRAGRSGHESLYMWPTGRFGGKSSYVPNTPVAKGSRVPARSTNK
jgi:hypothetical protein